MTKNSRVFLISGLLLFLAACLCVGPVCVSTVTPLMGSLIGCQVDYTSVRPCPIGGADLGQTLNALTYTGWLSIIGFPVGIVLVIATLIGLLIYWVVQRRK